jgi:hypothetical protein
VQGRLAELGRTNNQVARFRPGAKQMHPTVGCAFAGSSLLAAESRDCNLVWPLDVGFFCENCRTLAPTLVRSAPWYLHIHFGARAFAARNPKLSTDPIGPLGNSR